LEEPFVSKTCSGKKIKSRLDFRVSMEHSPLPDARFIRAGDGPSKMQVIQRKSNVEPCHERKQGQEEGQGSQDKRGPADPQGTAAPEAENGQIDSHGKT
jgi:hypothetical protein